MRSDEIVDKATMMITVLAFLKDLNLYFTERRALMDKGKAEEVSCIYFRGKEVRNMENYEIKSG